MRISLLRGRDREMVSGSRVRKKESPIERGVWLLGRTGNGVMVQYKGYTLTQIDPSPFEIPCVYK